MCEREYADFIGFTDNKSSLLYSVLFQDLHRARIYNDSHKHTSKPTTMVINISYIYHIILINPIHKGLFLVDSASQTTFKQIDIPWHKHAGRKTICLFTFKQNQ